MNFFYQAIKRAEGEAETAPAVESSVAAAAVATASAPTATSIASPLPVSKRNRIKLPGRIEKLVALLSPPVLDGHIAAMEECRVIRSRVREIMREMKKKTLMVTSGSAEEGKTLIAVNLAFALSHVENTRVLLVDADLRRPAVATFLGLTTDKGLHSYLQGTHSFDESVYEINPKLHLIPTTEIAADAAEILHGSRMRTFLAEASAHYDLVLIDAPPLFPIVDAQVLASLVDAALLVVRANKTSCELAAEAEMVLKGKYIGAVLNCGKSARKHSYYADEAYRQKLIAD
jgi:protein-tyrosine kinase